MQRLLLSSLLTCFIQPGEPHGVLVTPKPRAGQSTEPGTKLQGFNNAITTANAGCGGAENNDPGPGAVSITYQPGQKITISWKTTIPHEADRTNTGVRIAVKYSDGDSYAANVLAQGIDAGTGENTIQSTEVTLPEEKECTNCVLQWMWAAQDDNGFYLGCADIQIGGDANLFPFKIAHANFVAGTEDKPVGSLKFEQAAPEDPVKVTVDLKFANWLDEHPYHVHEAPVNGDCEAAGGHLAPQGGVGADEAGNLNDRHGPITPDASGVFQVEYEDTFISLNGELSVVGRSIVIHAEDGSRYACATIVGEQFTAGEIAGIVIACLVVFCLILACCFAKYKASQQGKSLKEYVGMGGGKSKAPPMQPNYAAQPNYGAPPPPAGGAGLPPNWIMQTDPSSNTQYYVNTVTGQSTWDRPMS